MSESPTNPVQRPCVESYPSPGLFPDFGGRAGILLGSIQPPIWAQSPVPGACSIPGAAQLALGRYVCPGSAGKPWLLTGIQTAPNSAAGLRCLLCAQRPALPALPCRGIASRACWHRRCSCNSCFLGGSLASANTRLPPQEQRGGEMWGWGRKWWQKGTGWNFHAGSNRFPRFSLLLYLDEVEQYLWMKMGDEGGGKALLRLFPEHCFAFGRNVF